MKLKQDRFGDDWKKQDKFGDDWKMPSTTTTSSSKPG